jgi:histidyl-tRNA synthetase
MVAKIKAVYERYGFDPVETPMFEYTDALGKFLPDSDRPNEGVFSLQDDDEQWMSLRYDLTAPLARHVAENFNDILLPYRTYRAGWVFRNEKPGPGRFRQFMQFDADTVGAPGVQADAEMCMMMADVMEALGIKRGDYVIRVNNRKVLDGVLEAIGLGGDDNAERRLTVLRAIDKLDKFGVEGVQQLLGAGRKDESGDFTKGAGLDEGQIYCLEPLLSYETNQNNITVAVESENPSVPTFVTLRRDDRSVLKDQSERAQRIVREVGWENASALGYIRAMFVRIEETFPAQANIFHWGGVGHEALFELSNIAFLTNQAGYGGEDIRIRIDPSCVRGLEYYTGPVFEAELLAEIPNEKGEIVRFGSVGGGGRYDGLVSRFMGQPVPATGFSIGVSRLMTALKNLGKLGQDQVSAPVLVTVMDRDIEALGRYQRFTQELRNAGIRAEMFQGNPKNFGNQLKYADRRACPIAIIQGGDEREQGVVQIKDLIEGKRASQAIEDNAAWREARVAQVTVSESELVAKVREMLAAQAEDRAADQTQDARGGA